MYRTYFIAGRHFIQRTAAVTHARRLGLPLTSIKRSTVAILDPRLADERKAIENQARFTAWAESRPDLDYVQLQQAWIFEQRDRAERERLAVANYVSEGLGE